MYNLLSQGSWWIINKKLTLKIGWDASIILSELITKQEWFASKNQLQEDGSFYRLKDTIEQDTMISGYRQTAAINLLVSLNLVSLSRRGVPSKMYFKIDHSAINNFLCDLYKE
jgi:hypothetical protein